MIASAVDLTIWAKSFSSWSWAASWRRCRLARIATARPESTMPPARDRPSRERSDASSAIAWSREPDRSWVSSLSCAEQFVDVGVERGSFAVGHWIGQQRQTMSWYWFTPSQSAAAWAACPGRRAARPNRHRFAHRRPACDSPGWHGQDCPDFGLRIDVNVSAHNLEHTLVGQEQMNLNFLGHAGQRNVPPEGGDTVVGDHEQARPPRPGHSRRRQFRPDPDRRRPAHRCAALPDRGVR